MKPTFFSILVFFIFIFFVNASCSKKVKEVIIGVDDTLSIKRQVFSGTQLKLNGYYYFEINPNGISTRVFYSSGVVLLDGIMLKAPEGFKLIEDNYQSKKYSDQLKKDKTNWGVYKIDGNKILIESWGASEPPLKAYIISGEILNDTTFRLTSFSKSDGSGKIDLDQLFKFKKFAQKPDSTNDFIK